MEKQDILGFRVQVYKEEYMDLKFQNAHFGKQNSISFRRVLSGLGA